MNPTKSSPTETPGEKLRAGRHAAGLTLAAVGERLHCSRQAIHAVETECGAGSSRLRLEMAEMLGVQLTTREVLNLNREASGG